MDLFRVTIVTAVIVSVISTLIETFVYDSILVVATLSVWTAVGQVRVFGQTIGAPTYSKAIKGAVMSLAWPLVPKRR